MTDTTTTVTFQSGATRELHPSLVDRIAGLSAEGRVVVDDGFEYLFGLTLCCNAYDKGMEDGTGCRACYSLDDAGEYFAEVTDPIVQGGGHQVTTYRERREARAERLEGWADKQEARFTGQRVMHPSRSRPRPERCAGLGHPGATFNAREGLTWCLCGATITEGDTSVPHVACCDGPLVEVSS